jgi:ribosomal protein S18 acetylase RimI-like enzyme
MSLKIETTVSSAKWGDVTKILQDVEMASHTPDLVKLAFENSHAVIFIYDEEKLVGFGRAISDGAYQAAIYDIAVLPTYQGKGIGKRIMDYLLSTISECNVILYSAIGKELFYRKTGFRLMKTGMALFTDVQKMSDKGFTD